MAVGLLLIIITCVVLAEPLYVLIGAVSGFLLLKSGDAENFDALISVVEMTRKLSDNEVLLAIPFFVLSGALMSEGDIARRLIAVAKALFAAVPGGLAVAAVSACVFFAAISGSSPVTVIAIGSIMYPAMVKEGYRSRFASGLVTSAGSLGILIPPSIPMIVYAIVDPMGLDDPPKYNVAVSPDIGLGVEHLFLAGVGPGLLIGLILGGYSMIEGSRLKMARNRFDAGELWRAIKNGFWALMLPVIILGGIYGGVFTPTQAAAVSVIYALVVEVGIHRSIRLPEMPRIISESTVLIGSLLIILALAQGFNKYLEMAEVAQHATEMITDWELSPLGFLIVVNILLLIVGMFMDILSAILILVPLLSPVGYQLGIHPMHMAIIFIVNLEIGYLTPPMGLNLFVASTIFKQSLGEVIRSVLPFILAMLIGLGLITYLPFISLGPVALFNGQSPWVPFPERRLALDPLDYGPGPNDGLQFLVGLAEQDESAGGDAQDPAAPAADEGRVLTLEEMMALSNQQLEQESMDSLAYETLTDVLVDYRRVFGLEVPLAQLATMREMEAENEETEGSAP
jgi:C4-dicarboxylate transporter DctM subunit